MHRIPYPADVDYSKYDPKIEKPETKYGLPSEVQFCKNCVISNQRPNSAIEYANTTNTKKETIHFDADGVCDACKFAAKKLSEINWDERDRQLWDLCDQHRSKDGSYDCLIPGSGGKDSFFAAHVLKYKYKMHPLTVTWAPHIYTSWGWNNFQAWTRAGFDNFLCTPNPKIHRLLTRLALDNLFHPFQPFIFGQKILAPKMANRFNIPLIFYGENEAEYGNPIADANNSKRDIKYFSYQDKNNIFIGGTSIASLEEDFGIERGELELYMPVEPDKIKDHNIETHYLGYYLPWHPKGAFNYAVEHGNFHQAPERTAGTYTYYNSIDDKIDDFHYYTTFIKFGIGRASYDASQEIRNGEMTRNAGIEMVRKYDGEWPQRFADEIFKYLTINPDEYPVASRMFEEPIMDINYFNKLTDNFRSPHIWMWKNSEWRLRHTIH